MLPNMFKLLFGGTPGLASRSALGDVKFLIGRSGLDFRLLSAMIYCVEFCGAFGTAIFFVATFLAGVLLPLFAGVFFFDDGAASFFVLAVLFIFNSFFVLLSFAPLDEALDFDLSFFFP